MAAARETPADRGPDTDTDSTHCYRTDVWDVSVWLREGRPPDRGETLSELAQTVQRDGKGGDSSAAERLDAQN